MIKQLKFTYKDKEYTLMYTRKTVSEMERKGFIASKIEDKPMTMLPELFAGAFLANHRTTDRKTIDEIYAHMTDKEDLIGRLAEMYNEPIAKLIENPENSAGNIKWTQNW